MTQKTFLGSIIAAIVDLFKNNWESFFIKIWKKVPDELQDKLTIVVKVVENIKAFADSPVADAITSIIPGELDDNIKDWLREKLPAILEKYHELDNTDALHNIATNLTQELTGMSYGQSAVTIEMAYQNYKKVAVMNSDEPDPGTTPPAPENS